jgi:hypothetical protein
MGEPVALAECGSGRRARSLRRRAGQARYRRVLDWTRGEGRRSRFSLAKLKPRPALVLCADVQAHGSNSFSALPPERVNHVVTLAIARELERIWAHVLEEPPPPDLQPLLDKLETVSRETSET